MLEVESGDGNGLETVHMLLGRYALRILSTSLKSKEKIQGRSRLDPLWWREKRPLTPLESEDIGRRLEVIRLDQ